MNVRRKKSDLPSSRISINAAAWTLWAAVNSSCGGGSPVTEGEATTTDSEVLPLVGSFTGVDSVEKSSNGAWLIRWPAIPSESIVYSVYKSSKATEIDYNSPLTTVKGGSYTYRPQQKYTSTPFCFAVRVTSVTGDGNSKSICVTDDPISFPGAESLTRLSDGSYMLAWPKVPADDVVYAIYERQSIDQFNFAEPSFDGILNNFFGQLSASERGIQFCYVVRYFHPDLPPDTNSKELCTEVEAPISFGGISDLVSLGNGTIKATWAKADPAIVKGYRLYQGSDFRELLRTVSADTTEAVIGGLVAGRQYSIGVRAIDSYGREDRNIRIRAIIIPTE